MTSPPFSEKRGNASWAQCPACRSWFNVTAGLLARPAVLLHCPRCQHQFAQSAALRINRGG